MDAYPAQDWLELAQDGEIDRAVDQLAAVSPSVAVRDLRLHLQLQVLALAPLGVLGRELPEPRLAIDWSAVERRMQLLSSDEEAVLQAAATGALRDLKAVDRRAHSRLQQAVGAEVEDLRVHLQLQELSLQEALEQAPDAAAPRLAIDWNAVAARNRELSFEQQRDLREAAMQAMSDLHTPPTPVAVTAQAAAPRMRWAAWAATAAAAVLLAGIGLYSLAIPAGSEQTAQSALRLRDTESSMKSLPEIAAVEVVSPQDNFRLPSGSRATLAEAGRIELEPASPTAERLAQTAGRVQYVIGGRPLEITLPQGQVAGHQAEMTIALAPETGGVTSIAVTRGQVVVYDRLRQAYSIDAGQTGYLAAGGAVRVVASNAAMPEFPLVIPEPPPITPFHPADPALATVEAAPPAAIIQPAASVPADTGTAVQAVTAAEEPSAPVDLAGPVATPLVEVPTPLQVTVPPIDETPPPELPPDDFTVSPGRKLVNGAIALPPTPEPGNNANGSGNGNGWAGAGNSGLHLGQGHAGSNGNPGGNGNAGGQGHGKGKGK